MNMRVGNTLFMKRVSHLVTYESDPSKTQVDYCLERSNQRKILDEDSVKRGFRSYINKYRAGSQKGTCVEGYWNVLKGVLLETTDRSCGWTKYQLDIRKHGGGMMMLVIMLAKGGNYVRSGNREAQVRRRI